MKNGERWKHMEELTLDTSKLSIQKLAISNYNTLENWGIKKKGFLYREREKNMIKVN